MAGQVLFLKETPKNTEITPTNDALPHSMHDEECAIWTSLVTVPRDKLLIKVIVGIENPRHDVNLLLESCLNELDPLRAAI